MSSEMERIYDILQRAGIERRERIPDEAHEPVCPKCQGAGYLRHDVSVSDPRFGELVVCDCTRAELDARRQAMLLQRSQLADLQHFTFAHWLPKVRTGKPPQNSPDAAFHAARAYADDPRGEHPWLFFYGTKGTGKTHLAAAIGNERLQRGQPAIFMVVPDLLDHLRATFNPTSDTTYDDLFESLRNTALLILDDLGTQSASPWAEEKLFQLINHRYNRRLPTVITMNSETNEVDGRLWSRINDVHLSQRITIVAEDNRTSERPPAARKATGRPRTRYSESPRAT
jgi:DNA replication protein DnaC